MDVLPSDATGYDLTSNTLTVTVGSETVDAGDYTATYKTKGATDDDFQAVANAESVNLADGATTVQVSFESTDYTIATVTFTATVAAVDLSSATVDASSITPSGENAWDASETTPTVTLGEATLTKTDDYTVAGLYTAAAGDLPAYYTLTITGNGDYTGSVSKYYYNGSWQDGEPEAL